MAAASHTVKDTNTKGCMVMRLTPGIMCVKVLMRRVIMRVFVPVDVDRAGSNDRPDTDAEEEESNKELGPSRPCLEVHEAAEYQPDSSDDEHSDSMTETPVHARPRCIGGVLNRRGSECREMVNAGEHMKSTGSKPCQNRYHSGTIPMSALLATSDPGTEENQHNSDNCDGCDRVI